MSHTFNHVTSKLKQTNRTSGNDVAVARAYLSKANNAKDRDIDFTMTFTAFKNICRAKKCYFTGLPLTADTITIDRIDADVGYVTGNVVACHTLFNKLKSVYEGSDGTMNLNHVKKGVSRLVKRMGSK